MARSKGARERILEAASDLFADQGYEATSVQQIVERAGVTKGAFYHHFAAKEDLIYPMYGDSFEASLADLERILALKREPEWTLRAIIDSIVMGSVETSRTAIVLTTEMSRISPTHHEVMVVKWRRYQDLVRDMIRQAQQDGLFAETASPEIVSWAIFGLTNSLHTWYRPDGPKTAAQIARELADLIMSGLSVRKEGD